MKNHQGRIGGATIDFVEDITAGFTGKLTMIHREVPNSSRRQQWNDGNAVAPAS
jgi:hypothetical protein